MRQSHAFTRAGAEIVARRPYRQHPDGSADTCPRYPGRHSTALRGSARVHVVDPGAAADLVTSPVDLGQADRRVHAAGSVSAADTRPACGARLTACLHGVEAVC